MWGVTGICGNTVKASGLKCPDWQRESMGMIFSIRHILGAALYFFRNWTKRGCVAFFNPPSSARWSVWWQTTNVPAWHGACVLPHINLVTSGYQQPTFHPLSVCLWKRITFVYVCVCVLVCVLFVLPEVLDEWGQHCVCMCGLCWRNNNHLAIDRHDNSKVPKRLRGALGEGERRAEWECIYKMRIVSQGQIR